MSGSTIFKGFRKVNGLAEGFNVESLEEGYIYLVRTDELGENGYVYFNGRKYGSADGTVKSAQYYIVQEGLDYPYVEDGVLYLPIAEGAAGPEGPRGAQGARGPQGYPGEQGEEGIAGERGVQGAQGPQGYQGATGEEGTAGERGAQGEKGEQGFQGEQGPVGTNG